MPSRKKNALPFDKRGGRITIQGILLKSNAYLSLSAQAKALIQLLHVHWGNYKPVDYGVREAAKKIPCSHHKVGHVFKELQDKGFIVKVDESIFSSRTLSKTRSWRLTWLPYNSREPTNDWEKWTDEN